MNSAARFLNEQVIVGKWSLPFVRVSILQICVNTLMLAILMTGIAIVFVTNHTRASYEELQSLSQQKSRIEVNYGQLLLEKGTVGARSRIHSVAQSELNMQAPVKKKVIVVS